MTVQLAEELLLNGKKYLMRSYPLSSFVELGGKLPPFAPTCTALWRGYVGTWEVRDERLYLISLRGELENGQAATLRSVFPEFPERVFAHWFSGVVRVTRAIVSEQDVSSSDGDCRQEEILHFKKGVVVSAELGAAPNMGSSFARVHS